MRVSELRLVSPAGQTLGKIVELMLDMRTGRIIQVLVSLEDGRTDEKLFALPWRALRLDARQQCFVLQLDQAMIEESEDTAIDYSESPSEAPSFLRAQQALH